MNSIFLIINVFLLIHKYISIKVSSSLENDYFDSASDFNNINYNFNNNIYLPEYQNKFSRINELNDTNFNFNKIKNNRSVALVPESVIAKNEKLLEIENIAQIINQIENNNVNNNITNKKITKNKKEIYTDDYSFYGSNNFLSSDYNYKYIKKNALIYDKGSSSIKDIISTEPEEIKIEYEICTPKSILFKIFNKNPDENLIIKDIKTDLYQVKIFPYISNKNNNNKILEENLTPNINSYLEHSIYPRTIFVFQLLFLLDHKTRIKGTLYIEFNDKKVLLIPIQITGLRNFYNVEPIYKINFQNKKLFEEHIKLSNPSSKTIYIKEIIHSFEKIKVFWSNEEIFNNNNSLVNNSMLEIEPISTKKILILRYYAKNIGNKYGFIHIRTSENIIVIPVLLNVVNSPIIPEPKLINFGICDITQESLNNFIRIIPLKLINNGKEYIKIGKVYINYDELFLQFHQNFGGNNIIIKPNEKVLFGHFIFNANLDIKNNLKYIKLNSLLKRKIYIETNSTQIPFVELFYSYIPYMNNELQDIPVNIMIKTKNENAFYNYLNIRFKKGIKLRPFNSFSPGEDVLIRDKYLLAKLKNPENEQQYSNIHLYTEIDKITLLKSIYYYYLPLLLNDMQYTLIPIKIDEYDLIKIYCGDEDNAKTLAICQKNVSYENEISSMEINSNKKKEFNIDFEHVQQGKIKKKFIFLINLNSSPIKLNNIIIENTNSFFSVDFEGYEFFGKNAEKYNISYPKKGYISQKLKEKKNNNCERISFLIYPYTAVKLSIILFSDFTISDKTTVDKITFYYGEDYKFILNVNASIMKGNLDLSEKIFNYEPSFNGLYQKKVIEGKNNYNFPINILSVNSNDKRIIPKKIVDKINPNKKVSLINILFDPSKYYEFKKEYEINVSNVLTYKELYLWKLEDKNFDKMETLGQSTINANISIKTSINEEFINVKGLLIKPNLVKKEKINFGLNQIGKASSLYIEGINPSDKILLIKLILADDSYYNINNNEMFNKKDKYLLEKNNDLIIFGCNFILNINSSSIIKHEYIVIPEKLDPIELRKGTFDKKELIRLIYKYGNEKVKNYLYKSDNILCKYDKKKQNEILFNKNNEYNYLITQTYSKEFNKEIDIVKNITNKNIDETFKYKFIEKKSFFHSIIQYLFNLYLKYFMNMFVYSNINIVENSQSFFIPEEIKQKIYQIPPHKTFSIGPILFKPNKSGIIRGTLFLKNNLTLLYPLKLEGEGGGGIIRFIDYYRGINKKRCKIYDEKNLVIEIDENIYENEIKNFGDKFNRTITLMNVGNLPMIIKNISIDNTNECFSNNLKIIQCKEISISPKEMIDIDLEIKPNYRTKRFNKIIYFNTEYQSFYLNVVVIITDEFYEKKNFIWICLKFLVLFIIIFNIIVFSINKIYKIIQKQKKENRDKEINKEEIFKENEDNIKQNNNKQNKGNKKKKRKKSVQKEDIKINNYINDNKENKENKEDKENKENKENKEDIIKNEEITKEEIRNEKSVKENEKIDKEIENKNEIEKKEKEKETIKENKKEEIKEEKKNLNISKNKKRKNKNSVSSKRSEKEKINDDKIKRENKEESISEDKKEKDKNESIESNKNNYNENEIFKNYNYNNNYNKNYQNRYRKGKKDINKRYYYQNYPNNRKYNTGYNNNYNNYNNNSHNNYNNAYNNAYNNNIYNNNVYNNNIYNNNIYNNNIYNNNIYNNNSYNNSTYNNNNNYYYQQQQQQQQQQKKQTTKITIKEKNVKNLKELFEKEEKEESKNKIKTKPKKNDEKNEIKNINEENDYNFDFDFPINKRKEENVQMNPTFLNDKKINNAFETEQELIKSLKKDNKNSNEEKQKDELYYDFNKDNQFNFNYFFFDKNQQPEEEGEYSGNYEDYKFKSIIDNLENPFIPEEQKMKLDEKNNENKNEYDDYEDDEDYFIKNKFNFNFMNLDKDD